MPKSVSTPESKIKKLQIKYATERDALVWALDKAFEVAKEEMDTDDVFHFDTLRRLARVYDAPELCDPRFEPPYSTLCVGVIHGGTARNILARQCDFQWEFRGLPGVSVAEAAAKVQAFVDQVALPRLTRFVSGPTIETIMDVDVPALAAQADNAAASLALRLTRSNTLSAASFATEAGHFQAAGLPTVVCGPGAIDQAHKPDEFIAISQLAACVDFMSALAVELAR